ncbi:acyl-CoA carboxylase subunit beta [Actinomyces ruminicola]|uniref:Acetyl-CoA carboxylase, carboxyltransferase component n=1 Tax=Actinomyces ruminicola TaxID=332524 RepID=A0A1G9UPI9_9ACTO|nr:acyl-CoA carboxylase subunit beta [Actinomyces ruminicola]SDM61783.1 Acetyl-CoA carboxylase, carboxyltransferase component [Actinomyces ruminicola]
MTEATATPAAASAATMATSPATTAFRERIARVDAEAEERAAARQHAKGKHTARERIDMLLDADSFLEIGRYSGSGAGERARPSGVVTGFGQIGGRQVAVYSQDFSVSGGALGTVEGDKIVRLLDDAMRLSIPVIGLIDSGGAKIQEGVAALRQYGRIFNRTCAASGLVPQISVIMGPCAGGAVYSPALTDFVIATREASHMFVTGPDVVRAVTGERISAEELGGADIHGSVTGVVHYVAEDEDDALDQVRTLLAYLPSSSDQEAPRYAYEDADRATDRDAATEVGTLVPASPRQPYDVTAVVTALVDHGELVQVQEDFAANVVVGFACFEGRPVGVVANQPLVDAGTLDVDASEKLARFVRFCDAFGLPVVTFVDVPGYRPGAEQEHAGIIRRGAKVINAYASATVPLVTVVLRKAYGGAYIVMGSKAIGADLNFCWPGAEIAVLGAQGAVGIIHRRDLRKVREESGEQAAAAEQRRLVEEYTDTVINPDKAVAIGEIDAVIAPEDTRTVIVDSLAALADKRDGRRAPAKKHDNGPL